MYSSTCLFYIEMQSNSTYDRAMFKLFELLHYDSMHYDYSKINNNVVIETNQLHGLPIKMYIEYSAH